MTQKSVSKKVHKSSNNKKSVKTTQTLKVDFEYYLHNRFLEIKRFLTLFAKKKVHNIKIMTKSEKIFFKISVLTTVKISATVQ